MKFGAICNNKRAVDVIKPPPLFYYEDVYGNKVPFDWIKGMPDKEWHAQHSITLLVQHSMVFGKIDKEKDLWPVRMIKWLLKNMPDSWKKSSISMNFNTNIGSGFELVKYLVEERKFSFNEAGGAVSIMCGRCREICESNIENRLPIFNDRWPNQHCSYCDEIDPEYVMWRRVWCCYRTAKMTGDVSKAYKENSPNSGKDYWK